MWLYQFTLLSAVFRCTRSATFLSTPGIVYLLFFLFHFKPFSFLALFIFASLSLKHVCNLLINFKQLLSCYYCLVPSTLLSSVLHITVYFPFSAQTEISISCSTSSPWFYIWEKIIEFLLFLLCFSHFQTSCKWTFAFIQSRLLLYVISAFVG